MAYGLQNIHTRVGIEFFRSLRDVCSSVPGQLAKSTININIIRINTAIHIHHKYIPGTRYKVKHPTYLVPGTRSSTQPRRSPTFWTLFSREKKEISCLSYVSLLRKRVSSDIGYQPSTTWYLGRTFQDRFRER